VTHLHIESPQETRFYASRIHELKKDLKEPGLVKLLGKAILHTVLQLVSVKLDEGNALQELVGPRPNRVNKIQNG